MITAPFGNWESPIDATMVAGQLISFQDLVVDGNDIYWSEMRPLEKGRYAIVCSQDGVSNKDILAIEYSARTRVHEYGGKAFTVNKNILYFVNEKDQRIYQMLPGMQPIAITAPGTRFADLHITPYGIIAIAEQHIPNQLPINYLACINISTGEITPLHSTHDFYAHISISPDYMHIAWVSWNHPNMPWNNNELWIATLSSKKLSDVQRVEANIPNQSFFQPQWNKDNHLITVSDKENWWNLYKVENLSLSPLFSIEEEIGLPLWVLNMSTWVYFQDSIVCITTEGGTNKLWHFKDGHLIQIELPFTQISQIRTNQKKLFMIVGNPEHPTQIISLNPDFTYNIIKKSGEFSIDPDYVSKPEHISFPSASGRSAHAYFYAPKNKKYLNNDTLPPLILKSHGGPTASASPSLNLQIQYWTSRGFAYVDVNYAGSTGYGREFRLSLEGNWGIYDVEDCVSAAKYLIKAQRVAHDKIAISGGSAGGYTTLSALTFSTFFKVGASSYGVSDLAALATETHKFESKYLDRLIGPYPEAIQKYHERSPIYHIEKLSSPVIFFQGTEDKIVPPEQSEKMYLSLKEKGIKTKYVLFEGESHGFRDAKNIVTTLEEQRKFFITVLGLT